MATGPRVKPVTEIKREATRIIAELRASGRPVLITEHGRSAAVLLDIDSYGALLRRLEILEGIARGERAFSEGRVVTQGEAKKRLSRWLGAAR
jgi:prevent-host-death family protein